MLLNIFLRYNIARTINVENSFFYSTPLPPNTKLTKELIELNYKRYSPFIKFDMIFYIEKDFLYIWFIKNGLSDVEKNIVIIPNSFLLYKSLSKKDAIYICNTEIKQILVVKNSKLLASSFVENISDEMLSIIQTEYQLKEIVQLSNDSVDSLYQEAIQEFSLSDIIKFSRIRVDKQSIQDFIIEKMTYPLIGLILLYIVISYAQGYYMQKIVDEKSYEFKTLKMKNSAINKTIHEHNKMVEKFQDFMTKELYVVDPYRVLFDMYKVIKKNDKAILKSFKVSNQLVKIKIETDEDPIKYLERLNKISYFENAVIENVLKRKKHKKIVSYSLKVKMHYEK